MNKKICLWALFPCLIVSSLFAQTIAEKKAGMSTSEGDLTQDMQAVLGQINKELKENQAKLKELYKQVMQLYSKNAPESDYQELLTQINTLKDELSILENNWHELVEETGNESKYALWHQPDSTLGQLIMDYGSQSYVYVIPAEIAAIKVSVDSNIPIPRASWNQMMELILNQNGVGYKQLNPYLRQLYFIKQDKSGIQLITNSRQDLEYLQPDIRICFVLSPEPSEVRRIWSFLDKFINPNSTILQMIGRDILIIAPVTEVLDLLKLYDFVSTNKGDKEYKIRTVTRVNADEMAKILAAIFDQLVDQPKTNLSSGADRPMLPGVAGKPVQDNGRRDQSCSPSDVNGLKIIPLTSVAQALFLVGTREEIRKAEEIINEVEGQVGEARAKTIYWYTVKHSDPEELAEILSKIYALMVNTGTGNEEFQQEQPPQPDGEGQDQQGLPVVPPWALPKPPPPSFFVPSKMYQNDFYQQGGFLINPAPVEPTNQQRPDPNSNRNNFIVDLKTGALVMVVEADLLPKMKDLIKKLDVPVKMVQIEALIFEKRLLRQDNFGLNLLRMGSDACNVNKASVLWNTYQSPLNGIFDFILSRKEHGSAPAFDLMYRFLITQTDISINANPTVVTVNQVPATIAIVEEISINTGTFLVDTTTKGVTPENAFTRAQYGLTINITPTVHMGEVDRLCGETVDYVTLDSEINFDTPVADVVNNRPNVIRRKVTNQVRIPDGQTVVIGGLRRKDTTDSKECIPFLGEIPGFGKLFSMSELHDESVELFIFLTPKIISDPVEDFDRLRTEEMHKRPGDVPEFMMALKEAEDRAQFRLYAGTMNALFGPPPERCMPEIQWPKCEGEYDGR